jgi:hypothetical protein
MNDLLNGLSFNSGITAFITNAEELKKSYIEVHLNLNEKKKKKKNPVDNFFKRIFSYFK